MKYLVTWIMCALVTSLIAYNKGRSGCGWFLLGLLLGPFALITAFFVSEREDVIEKELIESGEMKKCPYCAELIKSEAKVCRYCGKELEQDIK